MFLYYQLEEEHYKHLLIIFLICFVDYYLKNLKDRLDLSSYKSNHEMFDKSFQLLQATATTIFQLQLKIE